MALSKEDKAQVVLEYGKDPKNTGAIETSSGICSCGKSLPIIKNIEGRLDDIDRKSVV